MAGPQLSLAFDKQETVRPMGVSNADDYRETLNGNAKALTRWGLGYQTTSGNAGIERRYSGDFTNVYRDSDGSGPLYPGSTNRFHNGVIMLQLNLALRGEKWRWELGRGNNRSYPTDPAPRSRPPSFLPPRPQLRQLPTRAVGS